MILLEEISKAGGVVESMKSNSRQKSGNENEIEQKIKTVTTIKFKTALG